MSSCSNIPIIGALIAAFLGSFLALNPAPDTLPETLTVHIEFAETRGGLEVFPAPERASGRLFAAAATFTPHVAGRDDSGEWLLILYFDGDQLTVGWSPRGQFVLNDAQLEGLPVIAPDNLPPLPELAYDTRAARPYGVVVEATATPPTATLDTSGSDAGSPGGGNGGSAPTPTATEEPDPPTIGFGE